MKKEKSKVILSLLLIFVSIALVINLIIGGFEKSCLNELNQLVLEKESKLFELNIGMNTWLFLHQILSTQGLLKIEPQGNNFIMRPDQNFVNVTQDQFRAVSDTSGVISNLSNRINEKQKECGSYNLLASVFLYLGLIVNIISIIFSILILGLYKT